MTEPDQTSGKLGKNPVADFGGFGYGPARRLASRIA